MITHIKGEAMIKATSFNFILPVLPALVLIGQSAAACLVNADQPNLPCG